MASVGGAVVSAQARVRLTRDTVATLREWQGHALRRGASRPPTYGALLDAAVEMVTAHGLDIVAEVRLAEEVG
jgi:hypothetical protein